MLIRFSLGVLTKSLDNCNARKHYFDGIMGFNVNLYCVLHSSLRLIEADPLLLI